MIKKIRERKKVLYLLILTHFILICRSRFIRSIIFLQPEFPLFFFFLVIYIYWYKFSELLFFWRFHLNFILQDYFQEFPVQQKWIQPVSIRTQVQSLALLIGLRIWHCYELWCRSQTRLRSHIAVAAGLQLWLDP